VCFASISHCINDLVLGFGAMIGHVKINYGPKNQGVTIHSLSFAKFRLRVIAKFLLHCMYPQMLVASFNISLTLVATTSQLHILTP